MRTFRGTSIEVELGKDGTLPVWIHVCPFGTWKGHHTVPDVQLGRKEADEILANFERDGRLIPIDFEHQTESAPYNGQPAPATGFLCELAIVVDGKPVQAAHVALEGCKDGIWGRVEAWLEPGKTWLLERRYRYLSPVIVSGAVDRVTGAPVGTRISSVALTNIPFFAGDLTPVVTRTLSFGGRSMTLLMSLIALYALPAEATEAEVLSKAEEEHNALLALQASAPAAATTAEAAVTARAARFGEQVLAELEWKAPPANAAKLIKAAMGKGKTVAAETLAASEAKVAELQTKLEAAQADLIKAQSDKAVDRVEALIARGRAEGRIVPENEGPIRELAKVNYDAATKLVASLKSLTQTQVTTTTGKDDKPKDTCGLSATDVAYCDKHGIEYKNWAARLKEKAARREGGAS